MPIIENVGGVLRTHTAEYANIDGVLKEQNTVTVNDGGVLREVYSANKVKIEGITPLVVADDHIVITQSGSGTISLPAGARIILGSGGANYNGIPSAPRGGFVAKYTLTAPIINAAFTATVGAAGSCTAHATKLVIDKETYSCGYTRQIIYSRWGPIGGEGGNGGTHDHEYDIHQDGKDGTGAGGGGGASIDEYGVGRPSYKAYYGGEGGNSGGYGNKGGNGGGCGHPAGYSGSSGAGGARADGAYRSGCGGGGGGYAAAGGRGGTGDDDADGYSGSPGAGIIVIEW